MARQSGHPNLQSFNRIFRAACGLPLARYHHQAPTPPLREAAGIDRLRPRAAGWGVGVLERTVVEEYLNNPRDTDPPDLLTDTEPPLS